MMTDITQWLTTGNLAILVLTYAALKGLKATPQIPAKYNRWLPLAAVVIGFAIGAVHGLTTQADVWSDMTVGAFAGANSTWLDQFIKQTLGIKDKDHAEVD
jgi:Phage holin.